MKALAVIAAIAVAALAVMFLLPEETSQQDITADVGAEEELVSVSYSWIYSGRSYSLSADIPQQEYSEAKGETRGTVTLGSYAGYIDSQSRTVKLVAEALAQHTDNAPAFILSFVQSLDYLDDYETTGYQEYPKYPVETLMDKGGDCEDVAALYASLMGALGYDTALIYIPTTATTAHMMVGITGDFTGAGLYDDQHTKYFIAECTAKGWKIGDIPANIVFDPTECLILKNQ